MFISIALLSPIDLLNRLDWLTIVMKPGKPLPAFFNIGMSFFIFLGSSATAPIKTDFGLATKKKLFILSSPL